MTLETAKRILRREFPNTLRGVEKLDNGNFEATLPTSKVWLIPREGRKADLWYDGFVRDTVTY